MWGEQTVSANQFKKDLDALGNISVLNISINSPGGSVFDGFAIYNMLKRHKAKKNVYIDGLAASAASFIAMAGDCIIMPKNAYIMIHNASALAVGNAKELRKLAEDLEKFDESIVDIYVNKCGKSKKKLREMMDAETWMNGTEAKELGLIDKVEGEKKVAACLNSRMVSFKWLPKDLSNDPDPKIEEPEIPETPADELFEIYQAKIKNNLRRLQNA
jgi:ATP-dependent Clp protease protease subunit